jgi:colanic acid/amylovoran biosynthesis protein
MPSWLKQQLASVDAVLAIGGDNYSLDYRIPSPVMGLDAFAMQLKKPVFLWGSSVGPFDREPHLIRPMIKHLSLMQFVAVRESVSHDYLTRRLGLRNVIKMADPAFTLQPETVDLVPFWPDMAGEGVLGVNISHLIERYKQDGQDIRSEVAAFVRHVVKNMGMGVLLIPHVHPLTGNHESGDASYMAGLQGRLSDLGASVAMMPHRFNAAQIKHVISHLRFFIGARTHATIAALSSGVPTISIAYSIKARGINKDLFGHEDAVLQTPEVSADSLAKALEWLFEKEDVLRERLDAGVPKLREEARAAAARIRNVLSN